MIPGKDRKASENEFQCTKKLPQAKLVAEQAPGDELKGRNSSRNGWRGPGGVELLLLFFFGGGGQLVLLFLVYGFFCEDIFSLADFFWRYI